MFPIGLSLVFSWGQTATAYQPFGKTSKHRKEETWGRICNNEQNVNILSERPKNLFVSMNKEQDIIKITKGDKMRMFLENK